MWTPKVTTGIVSMQSSLLQNIDLMQLWLVTREGESHLASLPQSSNLSTAAGNHEWKAWYALLDVSLT